MKTKETDLIALLEKSLGPQKLKVANLKEVGTVIKVGDGICKVFGLQNAVYGELVKFEGGSQGIVLNLDEDYISVVLLDSSDNVIEQETAQRTGSVFQVPVGEALLGRIINASGKALDGLDEIDPEKMMSIEQPAPPITKRQPVHQPLETGITVIDALFPIGRGQRELVIGNRSTGKTAVVLDTILHQKGKDIICIYVTIGHKQSNTARMIHELERHGAMDYTIIVNADAKETALNQFLAPYTGCTIGEYFMNKGKDALILYDDLSNHAIAYRELSLLLRRPPGREAYPGDIFYIHSRLLERAGKLSDEHGGGSLTAIPIIQTQGDDISAYIPTNLISITDGQIFFDTHLFNNGIRPAVNIGLSVSRVGSAAQTKATKRVASSLKLELAQYLELLAFSQFGSELDKASKKALERGERAIEIFKQAEGETHSFAHQVIFLFLLKENYLDKLSLHNVKPFVTQCASYVQSVYQDVYDEILTTKDLSENTTTQLKKIAEEFLIAFSKS
ncbi:MAG: F0F1 ATP synthase subunit alpha [Epsilonproteobacteria bacterium]|nr:F0F1 ATP synthase subunit alpha [Campylobacterota bacterium]